MNELATLVSQRTGISQEDALKAVEAILDILKQRLPAPLASHLEGFLQGGVGGAAGNVGEEAGSMLKGAIGSFFGGTK